MSRVLMSKVWRGATDRYRFCMEIDMYVDEGEFVAIIGPNGCGKSTLIKTIFGIATYYSERYHTEGMMFLDGGQISLSIRA